MPPGSREMAPFTSCAARRHVTEIIEAGRLAYCETLNIVVWVKSNAGQGWLGDRITAHDPKE
jgi:hypothetical protein